MRHALHDGYLALIGEGFVQPGRWAAIAAAELAAAELRADQPVAVDWYARRALGWAPSSLDRRTVDALVGAVESLVAIGEHEAAIEHSPRLLARLAWRGGMRASSAVTLRSALARAHSDLGEHSLAIEHAGDTLARARRTRGAPGRSPHRCATCSSTSASSAQWPTDDGRVPGPVDRPLGPARPGPIRPDRRAPRRRSDRGPRPSGSGRCRRGAAGSRPTAPRAAGRSSPRPRRDRGRPTRS